MTAAERLRAYLAAPLAEPDRDPQDQQGDREHHTLRPETREVGAAYLRISDALRAAGHTVPPRRMPTVRQLEHRLDELDLTAPTARIDLADLLDELEHAYLACPAREPERRAS